MPQAFIAVDLGAQSGRVMLGVFPDHGFTLHEVHRFPNAPITVDGTLCWDVERLFEATLDGIAQAVAVADRDGITITGIAVDSWGVDYGLVDPEGALRAPVRHYRAAGSEAVDRANELVPATEAYARTGIIPLPINTVFQLVRDARSGLLDGDVAALLIPDLWTYRLTGVRGTERTIASTTGLLDRTTGEWAVDLMSRWGIPADLFPPLCESGSPAGLTTPAITRRVGSPAPIPVYRAPGHDTACAFAAVADVDSDRAIVSCGTWALVGCVTGRPALSTDARACGFTNEEGIGRSITLIRNLSGTWLLEECIRTWSEERGIDATAIRAEVIDAARGIAPLPATIDVSAHELHHPGDMPNRIADLYRRTAGEDRRWEPAEIVRLIIDSLAAAFATTITEAEQVTSNPLREIHLMGGGSNIDLLVERTRELTGRPVVIQFAEATSVGNICVQAVAAGAMPSMAAARAATTKEGS